MSWNRSLVVVLAAVLLAVAAAGVLAVAGAARWAAVRQAQLDAAAVADEAQQAVVDTFKRTVRDLQDDANRIAARLVVRPVEHSIAQVPEQVIDRAGWLALAGAEALPAHADYLIARRGAQVIGVAFDHDAAAAIAVRLDSERTAARTKADPLHAAVQTLRLGQRVAVEVRVPLPGARGAVGDLIVGSLLAERGPIVAGTARTNLRWRYGPRTPTDAEATVDSPGNAVRVERATVQFGVPLAVEAAVQPGQSLGIGGIAAVLAAVSAACALGGYFLFATLVQPLRRMTGEARAMAETFDGRGAAPVRGNEIVALREAIQAGLQTLNEHSRLLARAHQDEIRQSIELQRKNAMTQLFEVLAEIANECTDAEQALRISLDRIGEWLDWPVGRAVQTRRVGEQLVRSTYWHVHDHMRFQEFIDLSDGLADPSGDQPFLGAAARGLEAVWFADVGGLEGWARAKAARKVGLCSAFVIPIRARGDLVAFIEFFCDRPVEPDQALRDMTSVVAQQLSHVAARQRTEDELRAAMKAAEAGNRAKSQFLANMSHEIRTPMNGVLGMTELLLSTDLDDRQKRFAETVYRSGEALLDIINEILDFSKIEAGKLQIEQHEFGPRQLVEDTIELLAPRAHQKHIELVADLARDTPRVMLGDAGRLRQVLINLIGNAIKFTETGEVAVSMQTWPLAGPTSAAADTRPNVDDEAPALRNDDAPRKHMVRIAVTDTGIGMSAEAQARLFRAFEQESEGGARRYGGTGLGLAISKQLVEMMGGSVAVSSEVGKGSRFVVEIPLAIVEDAVEARGDLSVAGRRVLVVEDNVTNRRILQEALRAWGVECDTAEDGFVALLKLRDAALRNHAYEAALVDMKMPGMSGVELATTIGLDPQLRGLHMAMLTSIGGPGEVSRARAAGIEIYLEKPVRQAELRRALIELLGSTRLAPAVAPLPEELRLQGEVLLVEDNIVNQEIAAVMLERIGCAFSAVESGRKALDLLARHRFDLILMDCQMPDIDGFAATRAIRSGQADVGTFEFGAIVPIVALTANAQEGERERCLAAGFNDYLSKPFTERQLQEVLARSLRPALRPESPMVAQDSEEIGPLVDPEKIAYLRGIEASGAHGLIERLVRAYRKSVPSLMQQLEAALARQDADATRHAVHTLRSSNANLGADRLAQLFQKMEDAANDGDFDGLQPLMHQAVDMIQAVSGELDGLAAANGKQA